jgi:signal transduction histidine kinase/ActR/RegA family two-component response regulator
VPLSTHGQQLGALTLCFNAQSGRHYTPHELHLAEDLAHRLALALFNAQLYHQAQETNRIKDEFLAVLSHELRSPLNPILGWTKLLRTRKLDPATVDNALETIERNAKLQAQLVEDLLDVSRILQGKLCLDARPVNLVSTIAAALETVYLAAQAKSIQIQTKLDPGVRPILGDANRLQQVIWNLLSNAVKFTPPGGQVEIRLEQVEGDPKHSPSSSAFSPAQYVQVTITDTGKGINPEFLPYVFDYFRQADSATTRAFGGLGLGLAIVRHLVELHGGAVQVNSAGEDRGATFTVRLPIARDQVITQEQEQPEPLLDLQGVQVLVVDDNADMREFLSFMLKQYGAVVMTVASATEALQALIQSKPDILLSDVGMADVDGYMLIRQVRALSPEQGGQTPAIALTAYASEIDYQQALSSGFQMHISKPVEPDQLVKAISTLIQRD